jgi:hypothetical protein
MRWLRYDRRIGSWLALVALAIQLGLSFGHVHLDTVRRIDPAVAAIGPGTHAAKSLPAQQQPGEDSDDYCAICASIYLASNSFVPAPPHLPVPSVSQIVEHFDHDTITFIARRRLAFQSRAPPLA